MGQKRMFLCKLDEVPAVGAFLGGCLRRDLLDFQAVNEGYTEDYIQSLLDKSAHCYDLVSPEFMTQEAKVFTEAIKVKSKELRIALNKLKLFIDEADGSMSAGADGMGVQTLRARIYKGSSESVVTAGRALLININRNISILKGKGLKQSLLDEFTAILDEIDAKGKTQNQKITERNRTTDENIGDFNELWAMINRVLDAGRAIYRGVNDVKLKDYTLAAILQRISSGGKSKEDKAEEVNPA